MKLPREFYIPKGSRKVAHKESSAVAYVYERDGVPYAAAFSGNRAKPDWHYRFHSDEKRFARITEHFEDCANSTKEKLARRSAQNARGRDLEVGDILRCSWGYDQTNIDYYQVTALVGAHMVEIREIGQEREETGWLQGKSVPVPGKFIGEPMRKRAADGTVKIKSYAYARKMEPKALIGGKPIYDADSWTAYA